MVGAVPSPGVEAGWYPDPDQLHTQRYWDGEQWTDQRAPLVERKESPFTGVAALGLVIAGIGAVLAIVGVFLPMADTESNIHIASNSLMAHWEGPVIVAAAVIGFLCCLSPRTRPLTFFAGLVILGVAIAGGTDIPIHYRNRWSELVAGHASPAAGIWTAGIGGVLLGISAFFTSRSPGGASRMRGALTRWEEMMVPPGQRPTEFGADEEDDDFESNEEERTT